MMQSILPMPYFASERSFAQFRLSEEVSLQIVSGIRSEPTHLLGINQRKDLDSVAAYACTSITLTRPVTGAVCGGLWRHARNDYRGVGQRHILHSVLQPSEGRDVRAAALCTLP
jgi:hypothetical protein